jgi:hypothetical protein
MVMRTQKEESYLILALDLYAVSSMSCRNNRERMRLNDQVRDFLTTEPTVEDDYCRFWRHYQAKKREVRKQVEERNNS